ncbi:hypothetical protein BD311DRAFT_810462 [Dichomitus squalens]|uniref:G-protein coupled receptors family 1 profile domain-containing protein n=1 Tax=Dichomitus squalens TaxID=114155 RepID=A0A4Q9MBB0_9APHY|nr:hypothetical protein BD311DRAFT_810462 [Dichomitus squalens]
MSSNTTAAPATLALPPGLVPLSLVQEELKWLLLETIYSAFLVPIAVVLFFFSTPHLRRQPTFILNVCAIALGIAQGGIGIANSVNALVLNLSATPTAAIASVYLFLLVPFCVQAILVLRVLAAYPPKSLPPSRRLVIYGPIIIFKLARIANLIYMAVRLEQLIQAGGGLSSNSVFTVSQAVWTLPSAKAEWFLQLFDDMYASTLFILRLRQGTGMLGRQPTVERLHTTSAKSTYLQRLKTLFWIAVFNFVFPIIFNIAVLILAFRDSNFLDGSYIIYTNNYVEIIGVLLATIWAAGSHKDDGDNSSGRLGSSQTAGSHGHIHLVKMTSSSTFQVSESVDAKV